MTRSVPGERPSPQRFARVLVVTAVEPERVAVLAGLGTLATAVSWPPAYGGGTGHTPIGVDGVPADVAAVRVAVGGVGVAAAAACAGVLLAAAVGRPYEAVVSLGIAGGFGGRAGIGDAVIGTRSIAADLGADSADGFLPLGSLGFGVDTFDADPALLARVCDALAGAAAGPILSVSTVTGTAERATELRLRHPDAIAEAMEGYGVATAAAAYGVPFVEIRTVSNLVGPRDRDAWRITDALAALADVARAVGTLVG